MFYKDNINFTVDNVTNAIEYFLASFEVNYKLTIIAVYSNKS